MISKEQVREKLSMMGMPYVMSEQFIAWLDNEHVFANGNLPDRVQRYMLHSDTLDDKVIHYIHKKNLSGVCVTYREIMKDCDLPGSSEVFGIVHRLVNAGVLEKEDHRPRSIRIRKDIPHAQV